MPSDDTSSIEDALSASSDSASNIQALQAAAIQKPILWASPHIDTPSPIPLDRVDEAILDADAVEELLTASESSSRSASASMTPSRITAFLPPNSQRISETQSRKASTATITSPSTRGTPRSVSAESRNVAEDPSRDARPASPLDRTTGSRFLNDWPDPYGIAPETSAARPPSVPAQSASKSLNASPLLKPAIGSDSGIRLVSRSPALGAQPLKTVMSKAGRVEPEVWTAYRKARSTPLLQWWQTYIDNVSSCSRQLSEF